MGEVKNMTVPFQLDLFDQPNEQVIEAHEPEVEVATPLSRANLGTFQDSLRAPVHRWFTYPAGFSFKAVEEALRLYRIVPGMTVYDPFTGTGTTNIVASQC